MTDHDVIWPFTREARIAYFSMEIALALLVFVDEERIMAEQAVTYLRTRAVSSRA